MKSMRWFVSYILVAAFGLWLAFAASMQFMTGAGAQDAPSSGDLPPEFMEQLGAEGAPPAASPSPTASPAGAATPEATPEAAVSPPPSQVPPPPAEETAFEGGSVEPLPSAPSTPSASGNAAMGILPEMPYDPSARRDPFKAFKPARLATDPSTKIQLEPLQRYELEKIEVVGILWDVRTPRAMLKDPEGAVHTVVKNSKVGRNEGFVAAIREGEVIVVETIYEDGKVLKEPRVMGLSK